MERQAKDKRRSYDRRNIWIGAIGVIVGIIFGCAGVAFGISQYFQNQENSNLQLTQIAIQRQQGTLQAQALEAGPGPTQTLIATEVAGLQATLDALALPPIEDVPVATATTAVALPTPDLPSTSPAGSPISPESIRVENNLESTLSRSVFCVGDGAGNCVGFQIVNGAVVYEEVFGVGPAVCVHAADRNTPAQLYVPVAFDSLELWAYAARGGNTLVEVWAEGNLLLGEMIEGDEWQSFNVDIPSGAELLEVRHVPTGWSYEHLCISLFVGS
jgi:hypothetical protein